MIKKLIDKLIARATPGGRKAASRFGRREEIPASVHGIDPRQVDRNAADVHKGKATRVGFKMDGDKKVRFAKSTNEVID